MNAPAPSKQRRHARAVLVALAFVCALALPGCETAFDRHRNVLADYQAQGRFEEAAATLDDPKTLRLYGDKDRLLWLLDRGTAALAVGDADGALRHWEEAERRMEDRRTENAGDVAAALLLNDSARNYLGEPYEDMYLNVFKMLAQLEAGRIENGAMVEARRMAIKADVLREEYLKMRPVAEKAAGVSAGEAADGASGFALDTKGEFVESPLGVYLTAAVFRAAGEEELRKVAARRLKQVIEAQGNVVGDVDPRVVGDAEQQTRPTTSEMDVLIVAFAGRGPRKVPVRIPPLVIAGVPVYTELPVLRWEESVARSARAVVDVRGRREIVELGLVEEMGRVAAENHRRQLPLIYLRTIVRAGAKSAALAVGSHAAGRSGGNGAQLGVALAGLAILLATEKADLRCWELLPGRAFVGMTRVPVGEASVRVEWESAGGRVVYGEEVRTRAGEHGLATVVGWFWD